MDLDLRGEGTILGARQKGRSDLKLATLRPADRRLVSRRGRSQRRSWPKTLVLETHRELAEELRLFLGEDAPRSSRRVEPRTVEPKRVDPRRVDPEESMQMKQRQCV